jgi:HKD family nuclease
MELISNSTSPTHLTTIKKLLKNSNEVIICVAFLKNSGLVQILKQLPKNSTFYIGTDYYITEPSAIKMLLKEGFKVYLIKKQNATFHPKIYYFKKGKQVSILTGSANLTGGGLETNFETSVLIQTTALSSVDNKFTNMLDEFHKNSELIIGNLQLSQYEREFEAFRNKQKKANNDFQEEMQGVHKIELTKLPSYFNKYLKQEGVDRHDNRVIRYNEIKKMLDKLIKADIKSASSFLEYYDEIAGMFYSSDLLRSKNSFAKSYKKIIAAIKFIKENKSKDTKYVYEHSFNLIYSVKGFGINNLTEILNTYNPAKFSVANGRTIKSLADLGFAELPKTDKRFFTPDVYENYNNLISEIAIKCKAKDLGQVDHFLSWYYGNYVM